MSNINIFLGCALVAACIAQPFVYRAGWDAGWDLYGEILYAQEAEVSARRDARRAANKNKCHNEWAHCMELAQ